MKKKSTLKKISTNSIIFDESKNILWKNCYFIKKKDDYKCYICEKFESFYIPAIVEINNEFFLNRKYKHTQECVYFLKKIKKILKFYEMFKCDLEYFRKQILLFKEEINLGKIEKEKLIIAEKNEKIINLCENCILLRCKKKIRNPYRYIIALMFELEKIK